MSLLPHSIGQSKSQGQLRFKEGNQTLLDVRSVVFVQGRKELMAVILGDDRSFQFPFLSPPLTVRSLDHLIQSPHCSDEDIKLEEREKFGKN